MKDSQYHCETCGAERDLRPDMVILFENGRMQARYGHHCRCGSYAIVLKTTLEGRLRALGFSHEFAGCHDPETSDPVPTWNKFVESEGTNGRTYMTLDLQITGDGVAEPESPDDVALLWRHGEMREFPTYTALVEELEKGGDVFAPRPLTITVDLNKLPKGTTEDQVLSTLNAGLSALLDRAAGDEPIAEALYREIPCPFNAALRKPR